MTLHPKVSVILLNWNQYELTAACLNSLRRCTYPNIEMIVIDQASTDGSTERLMINFPEIKLIANKKNTGFTGGNNQGMAVAKGEYFLLLNNDTVVHPSFLEPLVDALESDPDAAAASPLIRFFFAPTFIQYAGGPEQIDLIRGRNTWRGWKTRIPHQYSTVEKTSAAHGAAFMIKSSVVERIGMLDEKLFIYYEEYDWSLRIRQAGYSILFVPQSEILHKESMTLTKDSPFRTKLMARNRLWLSKKYLPSYQHALSVAYVWFCSLPLNIARYTFRRKFDLAKALFAGSLEGTF
ncbi:MAG: glycosyltransferase family 2 protein [Bacteroidota bacterium]